MAYSKFIKTFKKTFKNGLGDALSGSITRDYEPIPIPETRKGIMRTYGFMEWLAEKAQSIPLHFDLYYDKRISWGIHIWCENPNGNNGIDLIIVDWNEDLSLLLSKAEVAVKKYLIEKYGEY